MAFFDWITQGISQVGRAVNEKIASFEKKTGIDIPFVGLTKEQIQTSQQTPQTQPVQTPPQPIVPGYSITSGEPIQSSQPTQLKPTTWTVDLGPNPHPKQIQEALSQTGGKVVVTPQGNVTIEFQSTIPKPITITPKEEILKEEQHQRNIQIAEQIYEKASPLEKAGMYAHTFMASGWELLASLLPGGKTPQDVVKQQIVKSLETPQTEYVLKEGVVGSLISNPVGNILVGELVGFGAGNVIGKATPFIAERVPQVAKVGEFFVKHPTLTKTIAYGGFAGLEGLKSYQTYKKLESQGVPKEEIAEKIVADVGRDVTLFVSFGHGLKAGLEKTLKQEYIIPYRYGEEKSATLGFYKESLPQGKEAKLIYHETKTLTSQPTEDFIRAIKQGRIVEKTPEYIIKEYGGYYYPMIKVKGQTNIPTQELKEGLIDVLRGEKSLYVQAWKSGEEGFRGVKLFSRKAIDIPVRVETPSTSNEPIAGFYKPSTSPKGDVLKELAESYLQSKIAEDTRLAQQIAGTQIQQMRAIQEATKNILGKATEGAGVKEVTSGGQALISIAKETPETAEYYITAVPTPFIYREPLTIPITPAGLIPTIVTTPTKEELKPTPKISLKPNIVEIEPENIKIMPKLETKEKEKIFELEPTTIKIEITPEPAKTTTPIPYTPTRVITPPKEEITPKEKIELAITPQEKITPKPKETKVPSRKIKGINLPLFYPSFPKGSVSKFTIDEREFFKQMTKYEPSLLGIMLNIKRRGKGKEWFTGFEIRGI
jgi:hypothetical protein